MKIRYEGEVEINWIVMFYIHDRTYDNMIFGTKNMT